MLHTMGDDAFDIILKVHVRAPFRLVRAAAPFLRIKGNKENRSIVNVSSTSGLHGNVGQVNYAAVRLLTFSLFSLCRSSNGTLYFLYFRRDLTHLRLMDF